MYSGWLLTNHSGNILGVHQRIDRVSRRFLSELIKTREFPSTQDILHFEGKNGPDGIKSKSPAQDEPWHFFDPFDPEDSQLIDVIQDHYTELVIALRQKNNQRISFEAAWLAHALVDGLTPAHHYPYEQELEKLRGGQTKDTRDSFRNKVVMPGNTRREMLRNNWKMWGPKGLIVTHGMFEFGAASIMGPMRTHLCKPTAYDLKILEKFGFIEMYKRMAREVALLNMYERYYRKGWTAKLAHEVRDELAPRMVKVVTLAWFSCILETELVPVEAD